MEIRPHLRGENTIHSFWVGNGVYYRGGELAAGIQVGISRPRMIPSQISRLPPACCTLRLCIPSGFPTESLLCPTPAVPSSADTSLPPQRILLMEQSWVWVQKNHIKRAHTERARGLWVLAGNLKRLSSSAEMAFQYLILSK